MLEAIRLQPKLWLPYRLEKTWTSDSTSTNVRLYKQTTTKVDARILRFIDDESSSHRNVDAHSKELRILINIILFN